MSRNEQTHPKGNGRENHISRDVYSSLHGRLCVEIMSTEPSPDPCTRLSEESLSAATPKTTQESLQDK